MSLQPLSAAAAKQLMPPLPSLTLSLKDNACVAAVADASFTTQTFPFGPTGTETQLVLPLPGGVLLGQHTAGQSLGIRCSCSATHARTCVLGDACAHLAATLETSRPSSPHPPSSPRRSRLHRTHLQAAAAASASRDSVMIVAKFKRKTGLLKCWVQWRQSAGGDHAALPSFLALPL
jgi:hypothetical protein